MNSPPHILCHFGMAGWFYIRGTPTAYFKPKAYSKNNDDEEWPPKYWKFALKTSDDTEAAFVDFRRFGRVRLLDCPAGDIRNVSPLKENGPDPVVDKDVVSEEWLKDLCGKRRAPIKALLLDQANISGIGNWVGDELLYHARVHPEQYANTLNEAQIKSLHSALHYVCGFACEVLGDSEKFPENWLFKHRWGKGKKDAVNKLPGGERIVFLTVGGRTSAVVPSLQRKTGPVAGDVKGADADAEEGKGDGDGAGKKKKAAGGRKRKAEEKDEEDEEEDEEEVKGEVEEEQPKPSRRGRKSNPRLPVTDSKPTSNPKAGSRAQANGNATAKRSIIKRQAETNAPAGRGRKSVKADLEPESKNESEQPNGDVNAAVVDEDHANAASKGQRGRVSKRQKVEKEVTVGAAAKQTAKKAKEKPPAANEVGRRRSGRLSGR